MKTCSACGTENPDIARFCLACGSQLAEAAPPQETRKVVSIVDHPRPFVKLNSFFGPERRRRTDSKYEGPERRKERRPEPPAPESDQDALNAAS